MSIFQTFVPQYISISSSHAHLNKIVQYFDDFLTYKRVKLPAHDSQLMRVLDIF